MTLVERRCPPGKELRPVFGRMSCLEPRSKSPFVGPKWVKGDPEDEMGEIERIVKGYEGWDNEKDGPVEMKENTSVRDVIDQIKAARLSPLKNGDWSKMENTDSWGVKKVRDAKKLAKQYGRNITRIIQGMKHGDEMPAPLVFKRKNGTTTLIGGNTRLMAAKALGITPQVVIVKER